MTTKSIFTSTFSLIGTSFLSAQRTVVLHTEQLDDLNTVNTIRQLEQNALLILIAAVVLMSVIWFCSILKACAGLNKSQNSSRHNPSIGFLALIIGLSVSWSSCAITQPSMADRYRMDEVGAARTGPCKNGHIHPMYRYPSNSYTSWVGPHVCRYCGQLDFSNYYK